MTSDELLYLQKLPLEMKIQKTKVRVQQWVNHFGTSGCYISFSGGKDSTVLRNIVNSIYPDIISVFCDTGLEYPEIRKFVNSCDNVKIIRPAMRFDDVIKKYGYPVISKEVSNTIAGAKNSLKKGVNSQRLKKINGTLHNKDGSLSSFNCTKYKYLLSAPFNISSSCCDIIKKSPFHKLEKDYNVVPFIATMASESMLRKSNYLRYGCNAFENKRPSSQPLSFWTDNDILQYLSINNLPYADCYGDIVIRNGEYTTTKLKRTGCMFCMYGVHTEPYPNRFQQMQVSHPKQYDYCINNLGLGSVLEYIGVDYKLYPDYQIIFKECFK